MIANLPQIEKNALYLTPNPSVSENFGVASAAVVR